MPSIDAKNPTCRLTPPFCLTIAGLDPSGGAGATADLRVFRRLDTTGVCALTALTPQNTRGVVGIHPVSAKALSEELACLFDDFPIAAAKTGQIPNRELAKLVVKQLRKTPVPLVIDPVMVPTRGMWLVEKDAVDYMRRYLLPLAAVITPNVEEASWLAQMEIRNREEVRKAARILVPKLTQAVVITGHMEAGKVFDYFYDGEQERWLGTPMRDVGDIHGSGCHYSSILCAYLGHGLPLAEAVAKTKRTINTLIDHWLLDPTGQMKMLYS